MSSKPLGGYTRGPIPPLRGLRGGYAHRRTSALAQIWARISTDPAGLGHFWPMSVRFTVADICSALKVRKHDVRAWLRLPPYQERQVKARSARKFTQTELVYFALVAQLHIEFGMSPRVLARLTAALSDLVMSRLEPDRLILINVQLGRVAYLGANTPAASGVVLAVTPAIERVQNYLLGELPSVGLADRNVLRLDRRAKA